MATSLPWFAHAGWRVVEWVRNPGLLTIIGLHAAGLFAPPVAGLALWRRRGVIACYALVLVSAAWLFWHIFLFGGVAAILRDAPRIILCVVTLVSVVAYALGRARNETA
jgi:hypothetical protein